MKHFAFMSYYVLLVIMLQLVPGTAFAQDVIPKTPPPPPDISLFTVFDPDFSYLNQGHAYITDEGSQEVTISGDSSSLKRVDKIGVQLTLQRWTGSTWVDVESGLPAYETDSTFAYVSHSDITVESGYYYRTKSYHWIEKDSITESGARYSSSILIN
ncbi:DUF6147 family protein [Paenibacillus sp. 32O-W]|uniref:DUF6147 family protein n=1 Tax=Paenibacillus sp. 32O-W TaxID=1695218 RepID=UPI000783C505|nr:DUF6147 family protein [Paenibacillus sp. 32O-W]